MEIRAELKRLIDEGMGEQELTTTQASVLAGVTSRTLQRAKNAGLLKVRAMSSRLWLIKVRDLYEWVSSAEYHKTGPKKA